MVEYAKQDFVVLLTKFNEKNEHSWTNLSHLNINLHINVIYQSAKVAQEKMT